LLRPISISLSPNVEPDDVKLASSLLLGNDNKSGEVKPHQILEQKFADYLGVKAAYPKILLRYSKKIEELSFSLNIAPTFRKMIINVSKNEAQIKIAASHSVLKSIRNITMFIYILPQIIPDWIRPKLPIIFPPMQKNAPTYKLINKINAISANPNVDNAIIL